MWKRERNSGWEKKGREKQEEEGRECAVRGCAASVKMGRTVERMGTRREDDGNGVQFLAFSFTTAVTCKKNKTALHFYFLLKDEQLFLKLFCYTLDGVMYMLQ